MQNPFPDVLGPGPNPKVRSLHYESATKTPSLVTKTPSLVCWAHHGSAVGEAAVGEAAVGRAAVGSLQLVGLQLVGLQFEGCRISMGCSL